MIDKIEIFSNGSGISWVYPDGSNRISNLEPGDDCEHEGFIITRTNANSLVIQIPSCEEADDAPEQLSGIRNKMAIERDALKDKISQYEKIITNMARSSAGV